MEEQQKPVEETILDIEHVGSGMFTVSALSAKPMPLDEAVKMCNRSGIKFRFTSFPRSMRRHIQKKSGFMPRVGLVYEPTKKEEVVK